MKSDFKISYPISMREKASLTISIDVVSLEGAMEVTLMTGEQDRKVLLIAEEEIFSDGVEIPVEKLALDFLQDFAIPDYLAPQVHEELSRRIMEFIVFRRNKRLNDLKTKNVIEGRQLHHIGYIDAGEKKP